jgi:hypothetical protein
MTDVNRANWNVWAAAHGQDGYYDRAGLIAGADSLTDLEWAGVRAAIGDVRDRDVLHVQCHIGFDTITPARHGARMTGVDFSPVALAKAAALAADPLLLDFPYADDGPHTFTSDGCYATAAETTTHVQFAHSIGEIVTAAANAGLRIVRLQEHLDGPLPIPAAGTTPDPDGRYRFRVTGQPMPVYFTLIAERPGENMAHTTLRTLGVLE